MNRELERWFLESGERGNPATSIRAWTVGNLVEALVHGRTYYPRLLEELCKLRPGDLVHLADWRGDADQCLDGPGTELGQVLADLARRGVQVRGLLWRSHPSSAHFNEEQNRHLGEVVNHAGGEILLDERVRGAGCQHQKLVVLHHPGRHEEDVAFVGGIDLCHGRGDDEHHLGDSQPVPMDRRYGPRPPWHDVQLEIRGPAVGDLSTTFRERWEDPTPLDHRNPWRARLTRRVGQPRHPSPLPDQLPDPGPAGADAVQILRTYPAKRPRLPFAPSGERSVARGYSKAFQRARRLIYVEDQFLWSTEVAQLLADALRRWPLLRLIAVVPRYPDQDGTPTRTGPSPARPTASASRPPSTWSRPQGASEPPSTTSRTRMQLRSTSTPRSASSTTCGPRSARTTSTAARGPMTRSSPQPCSTPPSTETTRGPGQPRRRRPRLRSQPAPEPVARASGPRAWRRQRPARP